MRVPGNILLGLPSILAIFLSCSDKPGPTAPIALPVQGGARLLPLSGTLLRLGSTDPQAAPEESPGWTRFKHDVWMDTSEVTQAEFSALLSRNPSLAHGDPLPVTNVSWFDAALCANARSKRDHLDTVYEYSSITADNTGNALDLPGLAIHFDRSGWRLPTEAEWEAAARAGSNTPYSWGTLADSTRVGDYAWYSANSAGATHPTGQKAANSWGLHDMAGNAMEWVSDWKGPFPHDTLPDYAGLDAPADIPQVALKGGAYDYGLSSLRPSSRTSTYPAYKSSRAEYVGFRLARGAFAPSYISISGQSVSAPPVSILAPRLAATLGAVSAKLVFVNKTPTSGLLSWIDFSETNPVVRTLPDKDPVFHPAISPDGKWVAWSTALEGSTSPSHVKIRRLVRNDTVVLDLGEGAIPRWSVQGTDTFLVCASAMDNTAPGWSATNTIARKWSSLGSLTGNAATWAQGSYHDGRSGPFLYTGYRQLKQFDTRAGTSRILFTAPQNGKNVGDTSQACNVSASPDSSGRVMFLDFGYTGNSTVVGHSYGIHQVAFISDSSGNIVGQIPVPASENEWDHLEWSNDPRWAVSSALDGTEAAHAVYLLDLQTGNPTRILGGTQLWQPALWVGGAIHTASGDVDPDSAGAYNTPSADYSQEQFAIKARGLWLQRGRIEIVAIGSSRTEMGIAPEMFHEGIAYNLGFSGSDPVGDRILLEKYVLPQCPRLNTVILSLMPGWLFSYRGVSWPFAERSAGYKYDLDHDFWPAGPSDNFLSIVVSRSWNQSPQYDSMGSKFVAPDNWGPSPPPINPPASEDTASSLFQSNWADIVAMASDCRARGIHLVLVNFPQSPLYAQTNYLGKYGPTKGTWTWLKGRLAQLELGNRYFHFYDANLDGHHDYPDSAAVNEDHLAKAGALQLSSRLDSLIGSLRY